MYADLVCSFCGRIPPEFEKLMSMKKKAKICNICDICVREFHSEFEETTP